MQAQADRDSDSISPKYPRKNSKLPIFGDIVSLKYVWQLQKSSFPIKVAIGVDSPEGTRRRSISVALPNSSHIKIWPKYGSDTLNKWRCEQVALLRCPANFCEFLIVLFYLEPHMHTNGKPTIICFLHFFRQVMVAVVFFSDRCVGHLSRQQLPTRAGVPFAGWCMINNV